MPVSGNASYLSTADAFIAHWTSANTTLGAAGPIVTAGGVTLAAFTTLRGTVVDSFNSVVTRINEQELARGDASLQKQKVRDIVDIFVTTVRGRLADTRYVGALPAVPGTRASADTVVHAMEDVLNLWDEINGSAATATFTPPLVLRIPPAGDPMGDPVALVLADAEPELAALQAAAIDLNHADQNVKLAREDRDRAKQRLYDVMKNYRVVLAGYFQKGHPLRESLPALTPPEGSTPDAVVATGAWDEVEQKGKITFTASTNPQLDRYDIRYCPGATYSTDDEIVIGSVAPAGPLEFLTLDGLTQSGVTALFRVYVVLTTGNERGSNDVGITRP